MKEHRKSSEKKLLMVVSLVAAVTIVKVLFHTITYEMGHTYTADAPLYWTVGRGLLNGIKPYTGLYENKPMGVFLIAALSFKLTNDTILCNVFSVALLAVIGLLPLVFAVECSRKQKEQGIFRTMGTIVFGALSGMLLMLYCEVRSGQFQVESMGAAWIGLYFWAVLHIKCEGLKDLRKPSQIIWGLLAALFVMCGVMMKEPFVLLAFFGGLLLVENGKEFVGKIVIPLGFGGIIAVVILTASGWMNGYLSVYIKNMFQNHIAVKGSPVTRGFQVIKLAKDINNVSGILLVVLILILIVLFIPNNTGSSKRKIYHVARVLFAIYVSSFAVGLGGQYYNHHYIFAAPFYLLLILLGCRRILEYNGELLSRQTIAVVLSILLICVAADSNLVFSGEYQGKYKSIKKQAEYVDHLLNYYGEDTYQYLGFNGETCFYGLTRHSPLGPAFAQDADNFQNADTWFSKKLLEQMNTANIVILSYLNVPAIETQVQQILDNDFTTTPSNAYTQETPPEDFKYTVYYRTSVFN